MKRDVFKTIGGCVILTMSVIAAIGVSGGFIYLQERNELLERIDKLEERGPSGPAVSVDPLTKSEIELIERLKKTIDIQNGDLIDYKEVPLGKD